MLTKPLQTRRSLLRKWMVVPLAFTLVALFSFTIREKKTNANRTFASPLSDTVPPRVVVRPAGTNGATPLTPLSPTTSQLNDWRSNNRYGILIDGTPVSNASLSGYKPYDFSAYSLSLVLKTDPQAGKVDYRVQLMTPTYYKKQVEAGLTGRVDGIKIIPSKELAPVTPDGAQPKGAALDDVLIVIDGVKQPHNASASPLNNLLAPDQIYSVTILKDEKAIQKYGPEATKGVIEIITKEKAGKMAAEKTITQVDQHAHFPGGDTSWRQFLVRTINANVPVDNGAPEGQYKVTVQFIVRSNGQLADIHATTQHGYGMETETIRLLRAGPNWVPAMQNGKAVDSYVQQSVSFVVEGEKEVTRSSQ